MEVKEIFLSPVFFFFFFLLGTIFITGFLLTITTKTNRAIDKKWSSKLNFVASQR